MLFRPTVGSILLLNTRPNMFYLPSSMPGFSMLSCIQHLVVNQLIKASGAFASLLSSTPSSHHDTVGTDLKSMIVFVLMA